MKPGHFLLFVSIVFFLSCKSYSPIGNVSAPNATVHYSMLSNWAAHPDKEDNADRVPKPLIEDGPLLPDVDVFFIHPTIYTQHKKGVQWNADISDRELNETTDNTTILYQASAFNAAGRVFAPRYRQAHIEAFYTDDKMTGEAALDKAYADVREAFLYYLKNYNEGRPIIIASHSQGTRHAKVLLKEFFDGKELQNQLVAAYIIGIPVLKNEFNHITPCQSVDDTECFISWRSFKKGYTPGDRPMGSQICVTNPLSWKTDETYVSKEMNKGGILRKIDKVYDHLADAQVHNGILWVSKPKFPFSFLFTRKDYHIADINFFYTNIRENAQLRASKFISTSQKANSGKQ